MPAYFDSIIPTHYFRYGPFREIKCLIELRSCTEQDSSMHGLPLSQQIYLEKSASPLQHCNDRGAAYFYWLRFLMVHRCGYNIHNFRYGTCRKRKVYNQMSAVIKELMKHLETVRDWLPYYIRRRAYVLCDFSSWLLYFMV